MKIFNKYFYSSLMVAVITAFVIMSAANLAGLGWVILEEDYSVIYATLVIPLFFAPVIIAAWRFGLIVALANCTVLGALILSQVILSANDLSFLPGTIIIIAVGVGISFWIAAPRKAASLRAGVRH